MLSALSVTALAMGLALVNAQSSAAAEPTTVVHTVKLAVPSVTGPAYTPAAFSVVSTVGGACEADLSLAPTGTNVVADDCKSASSPTVYPTTHTKVVELRCGGCNNNLRTFGNIHGCPIITSVAPTVTATVARTVWTYQCAGAKSA